VREMLGRATAIAQIAKDAGLTRQTVYRIRDDPAACEAMLTAWADADFAAGVEPENVALAAAVVVSGLYDAPIGRHCCINEPTSRPKSTARPIQPSSRRW
jgi:Helix-turn-helix domain of resolvase